MVTASASLDNERFGFTLFMSLCVHAVIILGVGFTYLDQLDSASSMEITLAQYRSNEAPENADFLAQANQEGSGNTDERLAPSTPVESRFNDTIIQDVSPFQQQQTALNSPRAILSTSSENTDLLDSLEENQDNDNTETPDSLSQNQLNQTLASLQAQLDIHRQAYAKRPRKYTISSASTQEARDALYLDNWRRKIEAVGNLNYPQQASAEGIYGQLRLLVALRPNGTVNEIRILSSSGHSILDEAAIRIVRLASPFAPFPEEMRQDIDVLEIIRTWQFHNNNSFRSF